MDVALYCDHENIKLVIDEFCTIKPKATFVLDKDVSLFVYISLKSLQFFN